MRFEKCLPSSTVSCMLMILCLPPATVAQPALASASFFGGPGDQYGYGLMIQGGAVYLGTYPAQVVRYAIPPGAPSANAAISAFLQGLTTVGGVIYGVGGAIPPTCGAVDGVGDTEAKTLLARYDLVSLALIGCQSHNFFPYRGGESYASVVYSSPSLYAAGTGETCGFGNNSLLLSQFDLSGNLLDTVVEPGVDFSGYSCIGNSNGQRMALVNSNLYIAAFSKLSSEDGINRPVLMKYGLDLTRQWKVRPTDNQGGMFFGVKGFGGAIYAVGLAVVGGTNDFLIEKYDEAGNRIWSKTSGGAGDDLLYDVVGIGSRLYAVGSTTSQGAGAQDMVILEIDPDSGNTISTTLYGGANDDYAYSAETDGSDLYVVGSSNSFASPEGNLVGQNDAVLLRYTTGPRYKVCLLYDPTKAVKGGSTLPVKLQLCDGSGNDLSSSSIVVHATGVVQTATSISGPVEDSGNANPDSDFRFDSSLGSTGGYIFNLKTVGLTTGTYNLNFTVSGDSFVHTTPFQVK